MGVKLPAYDSTNKNPSFTFDDYKAEIREDCRKAMVILEAMVGVEKAKEMMHNGRRLDYVMELTGIEFRPFL